MSLRLGRFALACRTAFLAGVVFALLSGFSQAQTIGIDWYGGSAAGADPTNQTPLLPADVAGVVPQSNWNSFLGEPASSSGALMLSNGSTTA